MVVRYLGTSTRGSYTTSLDANLRGMRFTICVTPAARS